MRGHIPTHYGSSSNYSPFTDSHIRQNHTMRSNENIFFNYDFSVADGSSRAGVKVRDDRRSQTDYAVVADSYIRGMDFIDVYELADPDVLPNRHSAKALQPRPHPESPGHDQSDLTGKPAEQHWQYQRPIPLVFFISETLNWRPYSAKIAAKLSAIALWASRIFFVLP